MDEETKAAFAGVMVVLGELTHAMEQRFDAVDGRLDAVDGRLDAMAAQLAETATKAQLDAMMARMNDGFERVLFGQHVLQVNDDTLTQRVTRLEQDVRQLRGGL
jgi:enoyl reductase-like protein